MDLLTDPASCPVCHNFEVRAEFHGQRPGEAPNDVGDDRNIQLLGEKYPCVYHASLEEITVQAFEGCKACSVMHAGFRLFWTNLKELDWQDYGQPNLEITIGIKRNQHAVIQTTTGVFYMTESHGLRLYIMPLSGT